MCTRDLNDPRVYVLANPGVGLKAFGRVTVESISLKQIFLGEIKTEDSIAVVFGNQRSKIPLGKEQEALRFGRKSNFLPTDLRKPLPLEEVVKGV